MESGGTRTCFVNHTHKIMRGEKFIHFVDQFYKSRNICKDCAPELLIKAHKKLDKIFMDL